MNRSYSLVEVALAVLVLALGLCSILAIFPPALTWAGKALASNTGSLAAATALTYIEEEVYSYDLPANPGWCPNGTYTFKNGFNGQIGGRYYCKFNINQANATLRLYNVAIYIYRLDFDNDITLSPVQRSLAKGDLLCRFQTRVYDRP